MFQDLPFVKRAKDNDWRFLVENYASHGPGETIDRRVHILPGVERMCRHGSYRICVPRFPPTSGKRLLAASTAWANPRGVRLRDLHGRAGAADCELPPRGCRASTQRFFGRRNPLPVSRRNFLRMLPTPPRERAGGVNSPLKAGSPDGKLANRLELVKPVRKRRIKKAGKKLDAEVKAVVWPEL